MALRCSKWIAIIGCCLALWSTAGAQSATDSTGARISTPTLVIPPGVDSLKLYDSIRRKESRKATLRSTFIPGWGQVTNKQAWKVPIVYAAIGIPVGLFVYNLNQYRDLRDAYRILSDNDPTNDNQIPDDLKGLSENSIKFYRDEFRRNVDYSALAFIIAWGLNVVDAAVFANLRDFDVSDNLSLRIQPQLHPSLRSGGVQFVFTPKNGSSKIRSISP